ncbi:hypothetical protein [Methanocella conradii]|uniref:hypothetical protein n=1 Tax=Methanocella conradii TaxID=1175444 RepID=UPI00157BD4D6|nr:hypothetical protein [Methanocella conradii]
MFIPLTINQRREGLPNVLIAGDTAGVFYLLSHMTDRDLNIFLADTGIKRPLREFPCHHREARDRANVYYDFFDGKIGGGIVRRMDVALTTSCDLKRWTRGFRVPSAHLSQDTSGTWIEFEGVHPSEVSKNPIGGLISGLINGRHEAYRCATSRALIDREGVAHALPSIEQWPDEKMAVEESTFSAWDRLGDLLKDGWRLTFDGRAIEGKDDTRLVELGIPELGVVVFERMEKRKCVELTGDLARVFDGLF